MADQLCTTAQVKARAQITDTTDDVLISELIDGVSDYIEDRTGRWLVPKVAQTIVFDTSYGPVLEVPRGVRAVTTLEVATGDQPDTGAVYTTIAANLVALRPAAADRRLGWPATSIVVLGVPAYRTAVNGARVTGDFGFAVTPPSIAEVAIDAVVAALATRGDPATSTIGADQRAAFPWSAFFGDGTPQDRTLRRYRGFRGIG